MKIFVVAWWIGFSCSIGGFFGVFCLFWLVGDFVVFGGFWLEFVLLVVFLFSVVGVFFVLLVS